MALHRSRQHLNRLILQESHLLCSLKKIERYPVHRPVYGQYSLYRYARNTMGGLIKVYTKSSFLTKARA